MPTGADMFAGGITELRALQESGCAGSPPDVVERFADQVALLGRVIGLQFVRDR